MPVLTRCGAALRAWLATPWAAGTLIALALRMPSFGEVLQMDAAGYLAGGFAWTEGLAPYRDIFDHKGPLNPEIFLALDVLLPTSATALRIALFAAFAASMVQLTALVRRHAPGAAWPSVVIYSVAGSSPLLEGQDLNTEQIALPLLIAAADLADRARQHQDKGRTALVLAFGAGAAIAAATGLKSIFFLAAAPAPAALLVRRPRLAMAALTGGLAAGAAILAPYLAQDLMDDLRFALFEYSPEFARVGWDGVLAGGARSVFAYVTDFPSHVLPLIALVLGGIALGDRDRRALVLVVFAAALGAWLAARAPGRSYAHYFVVTVPSLAVLCGVGADCIARHAPRLRGPVLTLAIVPIVAALGIGPLRSTLAIEPEVRWGVGRIPALSRQDDAAEIVRSVTTADERIYVMTGGGYTNAGQAIYWKARRLPASRYIFPQSIYPPVWTELRDELAADPPAAIVHFPGALKWPIQPAIEKGGLRRVASLESGDGLIVEIYARPRTPP
jgi:hypothetical protein